MAKIDRRITDIGVFDVNSVNDRSDPRIRALSSMLEALLVSIFGHDTVEYERYHWSATNLDTASVNMMYETPIHEIREGLQHGLATARSQLQAIRAEFVEAAHSSERLSDDTVLSLNPTEYAQVTNLVRLLVQSNSQRCGKL